MHTKGFFIGNLKKIKLNLYNKTKVFPAKITVLDFSKKELPWCQNNIMTATESLKKVSIDTTMYTDPSFDTWGGGSVKKIETGGM